VHVTIDQKISGYSAPRIRQWMQTVGRSIDNDDVSRVLACSDSATTRVLKRLQRDGFIESASGHLEVTMKGSALVLAKAAPPLRREMPACLIAGVMERARALNADNSWAYRLGIVVVFC
jgi:hypothetical protein